MTECNQFASGIIEWKPDSEKSIAQQAGLNVYYLVNMLMNKKRNGLLMCLAVPSKIIEIQGDLAKVSVDGVIRETSLALLDDAQIGDFVIVHAGFAISKLDESAALQTLEDMRQMLAADNARTGSSFTDA
jgi:hydrogenase expression/formation protein HypC